MPDSLAPNTKQPAKTINESSVTAMKQAPLKAEKPAGEEVTVIDVFQPLPQPTNASRRGEANARALHRTMIETCADGLPAATEAGGPQAVG
ncbi:MAG TPA: hypothetical protein VHA14_13550 [Bryobacteraceae bacterium]|nr:hypothetical protein [Bryobacteraceae bacterium]